MAATEPSQSFIVTIHALERMDQRFTELSRSMGDKKLGELIHAEVMDALDHGRHGSVPPLELAAYNGHGWGTPPKKGNYVVWTEDKSRGYVMWESPTELLVLTVLYGTPRETMQSQLKPMRGLR